MLYYYAHTGHKVGLERLRRGAALIKRVAREGIVCRLIVNDFRAGLCAREYGIGEYVTIETVQDIDAIAVKGDSIIIDSDENEHGRLVKYCADFEQVWRFEHDAEDSAVHEEIVLKTTPLEEGSPSAVIVDDAYFEVQEKEDRLLFFLQDMDYDKSILGHRAFFEAFEMELLLGSYFFVKYEHDLEKIFSSLHEPEMYTRLIQRSKNIVTASAQTALEAKAAGANVLFIDLKKASLYPVELLKNYGIPTVEGFDIERVKTGLNTPVTSPQRVIEPFNINKIVQKYQ